MTEPIWPKKRSIIFSNLPVEQVAINQANACAWNDAIESCIAAYEESKKQELVELDFDKLWVEFEKFLEPYTSSLIIKPDYAQNADHFKSWLKDVCDRFGTKREAKVSVEEIEKIIVGYGLYMKTPDLVAQAIHQRIYGGEQ